MVKRPRYIKVERTGRYLYPVSWVQRGGGLCGRLDKVDKVTRWRRPLWLEEHL